ncbi:MED7-domain-containing protein [Backusella circina FSU 941]|nr:MED7-domain-containing protein [Backusella circina FSU 941]
MAEQLTTRSAWPDPPNYYKRYTDENLALKKSNKEQQEDLGFMLASLEPPAPPTDAYNVFDQNWQVKDHLPTLKDLGVRQLFPDSPIDRISELKRLNRTLIVQFLELLEVLVERPEEFGKNIENISTIFINMHHILNAYRPHQARETLRLLMENQLARKKQQTEELKRVKRQWKY